MRDEGGSWGQGKGGWHCQSVSGGVGVTRAELRTLTYGPQHSVEGACVLLAGSEVLPGDLQLAIREPPHSQGDAAPQEPGAMSCHVLCDQR